MNYFKIKEIPIENEILSEMRRTLDTGGGIGIDFSELEAYCKSDVELTDYVDLWFDIYEWIVK